MPVLNSLRFRRFSGFFSLLIVLAVCAVWTRSDSPVDKPSTPSEASPTPVEARPKASPEPADIPRTLDKTVRWINVKESWGGCFDSNGSERTWAEFDGQYVSQGEQISGQEVERLRKLILASRNACDLSDGLGAAPNSETVRGKIQGILPWVDAEPPTVDSKSLSMQWLKAVQAKPSNDTTGHHSLDILIEGSPELRLKIEDDELGMGMYMDMTTLPEWQVKTSDGASWKTRCTKLSLALAPLCQKQSDALTGVPEFKENFVLHKAREVGIPWAQDYVRKTYETWPGYDEFGQRFEVTGVEFPGPGPDYGGVLLLKLRGQSSKSTLQIPFEKQGLDKDWRVIAGVANRLLGQSRQASPF